MSAFLLLSLLLYDLPAFLYLKKRFFPTAESFQQAVQWSHPPELSHHLLQQDWKQVIPYLRLPGFVACCSSILMAQYAFIQLFQRFPQLV